MVGEVAEQLVSAVERAMMYTAFYESIVKGGSARSKREYVLALAQQLARPNLTLVKIEFNGELIWFGGSWVRVQRERKGDGDATA